MSKHFNKNSPVKEAKEFDEEVLQIDRVTRVVKGGRRLRFRATVVIGNRNGKVGVGIGKSEEVVGAIQKGISDAKKNLILVKMAGTTIPHEMKVKYKSAQLLIMPAAPGTGIIAGGAVRKVVEFSGIKDILSKSFGTTNKISNARAALKALGQLKDTPFSIKRRQVQAPAPVDKPIVEIKKAEDKGGKPHSKPQGKQPRPVAKPEAPKQQNN